MRKLIADIRKSKFIYLLILPGLLQILLYDYVPFYYLQIAFKDFNVFKGLEGSEWVGFQKFAELFAAEYFIQSVRNTFIISGMQIAVGFFVPVVLAMLLNELRSVLFARSIQTILYLPHFLSWVIIGGLFATILSPYGGVVNVLLGAFGIDPIYFMADRAWFRWVLVFSEIWKEAGWASIIYLAAILSIGSEQYESAIVDGANRFQRMLYITFPALVPTMLVVLLLKVSKILNLFTQVFVMYNPVVAEVSETIGTYVYLMGIQRGDLSFATAAGMFNSLVSLVMVLTANFAVKHIRGTSIV